jgi:hypothetical protein
LAVRAQVHDLASARHDDQPPGQAPVVDVPGEVPVESLEPLRIEAGVLRLDLDFELSHPGPPSIVLRAGG